MATPDPQTAPNGIGPGGGAGGGGAAAAPPSADEPNEYSFLTMDAISEMCNGFEEGIKGQSNRELISDFKNLLESAVALTLGHEIGGAVKPRNSSNEQMTGAL